MSQLVSARLPEETVERMRQYARRKQRSLNETIHLALEEWLRSDEYKYIEFRDTPDGRMAYMKNSRLPVYWVVKVAQGYDMDMEKVLAYWPQHSRDWVQAALNYYASFPNEINVQIAHHASTTFEALRRRFPQIEAFSVPDTPENLR